MLDPANPIIPLLWGVLLFERRKYDEAIEKFSHSALYGTDKYDANYYTALCYLKKEEFGKAIKYAKEACEIRPKMTEPYLVLGEAYMNAGSSELSFKAYETAANEALKTPALYIGWGIALQKFKKYDEAREKFYEALLLAPNDELLLASIATNYIMTKEYEDAEKYLQRLVEINPKNARAHYNLALIRFEEKKYDEALRLYQTAFSLSPKNYALYFNIADCYYRMGNLEEAKKYYKKCIEYVPKHMQAYLSLANLLLETNDYKDALRKVRTVYTMNKESSAANFAYGVVLMKSGLLDDAMEKFQASLSLDEHYAIAKLGIAECNLYFGKYKESLVALESVMEELGQESDFLKIQENLLEKIVSDDTYCEVDFVIKYCNKFLERYNNNKVSEIRDTLVGKTTK